MGNDLSLIARGKDGKRDFRLDAVPSSHRIETFCPVCGDEKRVFFHEERTYPIWKCGRCSHVYVSPRPSDAWLAAFYSRKEGMTGRTDADGCDANQSAFAATIRAITRFHGRPHDVLDVGAGYGGFLSSAAQLGWRLHGIEPNEAALGVARERLERKASLTLATFENATFAPCSFDCILILNVIEHVSQPREACRKAFELLRPGGCLVLRCPPRALEWRSLWPERLLGPKPKLQVPAHLHQYSAKSIRTLMQLAGLHDIRFYWPGPAAPSVKSSPVLRAAFCGAVATSRAIGICALGRVPPPFLPKLVVGCKPKEVS